MSFGRLADIVFVAAPGPEMIVPGNRWNSS